MSENKDWDDEKKRSGEKEEISKENVFFRLFQLFFRLMNSGWDCLTVLWVLHQRKKSRRWQADWEKSMNGDVKSYIHIHHRKNILFSPNSNSEQQD